VTEAIQQIQVSYPITADQIVADLTPLLALEKPAEVVKAIATCRGLRVQVEDRRKLLKADSLEYGRRVDEAAKLLTAAILRYEEPLKERKAKHDAAKAEAKRAAEQAERERLMAEERAKIQAEREAAQQEAEIQAKRRAAEERQLEQRRVLIRREKEQAEAELLAMRRQAEAERAESQRILREAEQARRAAEETLAKIEREKEAERTRARMAAEAEEQRLEREKYERELAAKIEAAQPDVVKLHAYAERLRSVRLSGPVCVDDDARAVASDVHAHLGRLVDHLLTFDGSPLEDAP
jgi:hypothetical protein